MSVVKLELWRPLIDFEKEFDSLFRFPRFLSEKGDFPFHPSIDVERENGELIVSAELPGIDPDKDVEITLDDDYLTIKGEKSEDKEISEDDRYMHERRYGKFVRRVPVPEGVTADKIAADYAKGVLTVKVTLPKETEPAEPQKIPVGSKKT
ncbi:MAG TPA: Hsp20/alpha crystallin family protein [Acidimicrobiia bacterium]